jgi:hypothetical protein
MKAYWLKATLFLLVVSGYALAQSNAPSLGDIARQNRGKKKKATIVLSDDDQRFSRSATSSMTSSSAPSAPPAEPTTANSSSAKPLSKNETDKSASPPRAKDAPASTSAGQKLDFYKSELEAWKTITKRDEDSLAKETVPFRQQMYQDALDGDRRTMAAFKEKIDQMEKETAKDQKNDSSSSNGK